MFKIGDHGQAVLEFQKSLIELGEELPRWGADGGFGSETCAALSSLLTKQGRKTVDDPDPKVADDAEIALVNDLLRRKRTTPAVPRPARLIDRRQQVGTYGDYGHRPWTRITGVTVHQTACILSASKDPARCDKVTTHFVIMRGGGYYSDGDVIWNHDFDRITAHANGFNNLTWGVEVDGIFAGVEGDPSTVWDDPSTKRRETAVSITPAQIRSLKELVRWGHYVIAANGGLMSKILPHRCSSGNRQDDPGSLTWGVARELKAELGLDDGGPGFKIGDGYPIPEAWDPTRVGVKY